MPGWSQAQQLDNVSGLWYKFKQNSNGNMEILCSGDKDSLESESVVYHDHYWQNNGRWYFQGKSGNKHIIGKDGLIEGIQRQNQRGRLDLTEAEKQELSLTSNEGRQLTDNEVKKLANYRARQAYGNAGYGGNNHGVEVDSYVAEILNKQVKQYQESTISTPELSRKKLKWRDADNNTTSVSTNPQLNSSHQSIKLTRKTTR